MADAKLGKAVIEITVDGSQMTAAFAKGEKATQAFADKASKTLGNIGSKMTVGATLPIVGLAAVAIKAASDTAESLNKMQVIFGTSAAGIQAWAQSAAKNMGLSRQEAYEAASSFGSLFNAMGMSKTESAAMSMRLVELAADLGSFNNIDPSVALEKLRSGLVGETEPLRSLQIVINENMVTQEAYRLGLAKTGSVVSESAKIQARYSLILQQSGAAQGDHARTADGLANSTRTANKELMDAAATLGENLIPLAKEGVNTLNDLAEAFNKLGPKEQQWIITISIGVAIAGPVAKLLGALFGLGVGGGLAGLLGLPVVASAIGINALAEREKQKSPFGQEQWQAESRLEVATTELARTKQQLADVTETGEEAAIAMAKAQVKEAQATYDAAKATVTLTKAKIEQAKAPKQMLGPVNAWPYAWLNQGQGNIGYAESDYKAAAAMGAAVEAGMAQTAQDILSAATEATRKAEELRVQAAQEAANKIATAFDSLAGHISGVLDDAAGRIKGLAPGLGDMSALAPGKGSWAEPFYRIADIAVHGPGSGQPMGADTAKWMAKYGLSTEQAKAVTQAAAQGDWLNPAVAPYMNWTAMAQMAQQQMEAERARAFLPQAVAGLATAGVPLTTENIKAAVDELAAQDKANALTFDNMKSALATLGGNSTLADIVRAIDNLPKAAGANGTGLGTTVNVNGVQVTANSDETAGAAAGKAIDALLTAEQRRPVYTTPGHAGNQP